MEWVVVILLLLNMSILGVICLIMAGFLTHVRSGKEDATQYSSPTPSESVKEETIPEDNTVPLEQFTPDFKKPLKFVVKEDGDQTVLEEDEIQR